MLSFLREQDNEKLTAQKTANANGQADPGASENTQKQEYLVVAAHNKSVRKSTILVAILFSLGLLCLLFMIKNSKPRAAAASTGGVEEKQIEGAIARLTGVSSEMFSRMDQIVKKFYEFSNVFQVRVNELAKNPFELEMYLSTISPKVEPQKVDDSVDVNTDIIRQEHIKQIAKEIQLLGIMQTDQGNCCMIDSKIFYEGDLVKSFKVTQIKDNFVKLEWQELNSNPGHSAETQNIEIVLKLSE